MAFTLGEDKDVEMKEAFEKDSSQLLNKEQEIKNGFKKHKKIANETPQ